MMYAIHPHTEILVTCKSTKWANWHCTIQCLFYLYRSVQKAC